MWEATHFPGTTCLHLSPLASAKFFLSPSFSSWQGSIPCLFQALWWDGCFTALELPSAQFQWHPVSTELTQNLIFKFLRESTWSRLGQVSTQPWPEKVVSCNNTIAAKIYWVLTVLFKYYLYIAFGASPLSGLWNYFQRKRMIVSCSDVLKDVYDSNLSFRAWENYMRRDMYAH